MNTVKLLTKEILKKLKVMGSLIEFLEKNNLLPINLDRLDLIKGDYCERIQELKSIKDLKISDCGNNLTYIDGNGRFIERTYDANGNELTYSDSIGRWIEITYDANGRELTFKNSYGLSIERAYDANGNRLYYRKSNCGFLVERSYDTNGNEYIQSSEIKDGKLYKIDELDLTEYHKEY